MRFGYKKMLRLVGIGRKPKLRDRQEADVLPMHRNSGVPKDIIGRPRLVQKPRASVFRNKSVDESGRQTPAVGDHRRPTWGFRRKTKQARAAQRRAIRSGIPVSKRQKRRSRVAA